MVAVTCVDSYPFFLAFSYLTYHLEGKVSPSSSKNTGVVLVACSHMEVHPYSFFQWCGYF